MQTSIPIDDDLAARALAELGPDRARAAVEAALRDSIRIKRQLEALDVLRGSGWDGDEDEVRGNRYVVEA